MKHIKTYQLFESIHDTKEQIEEIISTCKDILLEANDTFSSNSNVERSYKDDKLIITCVYKLPFFAPRKIEEYKSAIDDIHSRLIEYMTSQGFTYNNRGDKSTAYFDIILGNITYNISFSKQLDREFIGHLRYLKKYNINESITYKIFENSYLDINEFEDTTKDILIELEDSGLQVNYSRLTKDVEIDPERFRNNIRTDRFLEVYITRPFGAQKRQIPGVVNPEGGYPGNLFFWYEIKEHIVRLTEWYFSSSIHEPIDKESKYRWEKSSSPLRFFASGIEMAIGFSKEEDFSGIGDYISFSNFRIELKF